MAELLDDIVPLAWAEQRTGNAERDHAVGALLQSARLLGSVADSLAGRGGPDDGRFRAISAVVRHCQELGPVSEARGRVAEVLAGAADLVATMRPEPSAGESWAIACAMIEPTQACVSLLRQVANSPTAIDLAVDLDVLRRLSDARPPAPADGARLDQVRPATFTTSAQTITRIRDLVDDIAYRASSGAMTTGDARAFAAAGLTVAVYAKPIAVALAGGDAKPLTVAACDAMVAGWFALRDSTRDVAARARTTPNSVVVAELAHELTTAFGPPTRPDVTGMSTPAELATGYRAMANRLPGLARAIGRAAVRWGTEPSEATIDSAQPIPWRAAGGVVRYAGISPTEVPKAESLHLARTAVLTAHASVVVAVHADETAMRIGHQPHTHLARAHVAEVPHASPATRWLSLAVSIDRRLIADPDWPSLASTLDRAAQTGWDPESQLRRIAGGLPDRRSASELTYRVRAVCELKPPAPIESAAATTDGGRRAVATSRDVPLTPVPWAAVP